MSRESERPTREALGKATGQSADKPLRRGTLLGGRYRIDAVLGYGGMGVVYRARDLKLDLDIALKRIRPDRMSPERRETLRREIILSRKVTHENVCRIYDLVELDGEEFVSMEFLPGKTLKEIENQEKTLPLGRGLAIAKKICRGLAAAHRIGVLHRDLKPENVIVSDDGTPRLMDFGIAIETALYRGEGDDTVPGTPQFLAPELLRSEAPTIRSDVYAMGVVLFEMFTGQVPFDDADTVRLVRRITSEDAPRAATLRPDLPPTLLDILDRAIAKDPESRFPDADSLADAISAFEGEVLERMLAEVSVTRSKMVKLMVILEANKSLAATFDSTETLKIILKTATSETDAERGTIFLKEPGKDELVSQILEGGSVAPIRLPIGRGIAGTVARTGETINIPDAYNDPRFDARTDASSGYQTRTILAAPMRTPRGDIAGVVELLNKRRRAFTKEDEEFLAEVGTHAALAVESVRQHEAAVARARQQGETEAARAARDLLEPASWPPTPGFECAPLTWRSETLRLFSYAVEAAPGRLALLLLECPGSPATALASLIRAGEAGRSALAESVPGEVIARVRAAEPSCAAAAARWEGSRLRLASAGRPLPVLLRGESPAPAAAPAAEDTQISSATFETAAQDLLVLASGGLAGIRLEKREIPTEDSLGALARAARGRPIASALADLLAGWERAAFSPASGDVLLLAARRA